MRKTKLLKVNRMSKTCWQHAPEAILSMIDAEAGIAFESLELV